MVDVTNERLFLLMLVGKLIDVSHRICLCKDEFV